MVGLRKKGIYPASGSENMEAVCKLIERGCRDMAAHFIDDKGEILFVLKRKKLD
jgi:hypothetical protein